MMTLFNTPDQKQVVLKIMDEFMIKHNLGENADEASIKTFKDRLQKMYPDVIDLMNEINNQPSDQMVILLYENVGPDWSVDDKDGIYEKLSKNLLGRVDALEDVMRERLENSELLKKSAFTVSDQLKHERTYLRVLFTSTLHEICARNDHLNDWRLVFIEDCSSVKLSGYKLNTFTDSKDIDNYNNLIIVVIVDRGKDINDHSRDTDNDAKNSYLGRMIYESYQDWNATYHVSNSRAVSVSNEVKARIDFIDDVEDIIDSFWLEVEKSAYGQFIAAISANPNNYNKLVEAIKNIGQFISIVVINPDTSRAISTANAMKGSLPLKSSKRGYLDKNYRGVMRMVSDDKVAIVNIKIKDRYTYDVAEMRPHVFVDVLRFPEVVMQLSDAIKLDKSWVNDQAKALKKATEKYRLTYIKQDEFFEKVENHFSPNGKVDDLGDLLDPDESFVISEDMSYISGIENVTKALLDNKKAKASELINAALHRKYHIDYLEDGE